MLGAWSIRNRVPAPTDDRFSDTVLVVCPSVTIRERHKELAPVRGDLRLYRIRQLVPPEHTKDLCRAEVPTGWSSTTRPATSAVALGGASGAEGNLAGHASRAKVGENLPHPMFLEHSFANEHI